MRQTDELRSIARFIGGTLSTIPDPKPMIYFERPRGSYARPAFRIDNPTSIRVPATNAYMFDERTWIVSLFAKTKVEAARLGEGWIDKLTKSPTAKNLIPLWIFDFPYYAPLLYSKTVSPVTAFAAGTYSVQIVAENVAGQLSSASPVSSITIAVGKAIEVQVPLEPKGWPIGKKFHVYLSGTGLGAAHRIGAVTYATNVDPRFVILADVPGGIAAAPAPALLSGLLATSELRYRYMRVLEQQVELMEDTQEDKLWNHIVRMRTQTVGPREYTHDQMLGVLTSAMTTT